MIMSAVEDATGMLYATMLASSGSALSTKPAGTANAMPTLGSETFGGLHGEKVHDKPVRETEVPSGQIIASIGHAIGCDGCSTAFRYTSPPTPIMIMSKIQKRRVFIV